MTSPSRVDANDPYFSVLPVIPPLGRSASKIVRDGAARKLFDAERKLAEIEQTSARVLDDITQTIAQAKTAGYEDGRREADLELAAELARIERQSREFYDEASHTIADLAVRIAARIIGKQTQEPLLLNTVRQAIAEHAQDDPYCIQVAADTRKTAEDALAQLRREKPALKLPAVRVDARLPSGRAILVTRFGTVDLDIESQLRAIRDSLTAGKVEKTSVAL